jgi:hypothetical protein
MAPDGGGGSRRQQQPRRGDAGDRWIPVKSTAEKERQAAATKCRGKKSLGERTLIFGSVYHVMNSTYIHLRTKDPNIYMYRRGEYIKNPWINTIIKKLIHI